MRCCVTRIIDVPVNLGGFRDVHECGGADHVKYNVVRVSESRRKIMDRWITGRIGTNQHDLAGAGLRDQEIAIWSDGHEPGAANAREYRDRKPGRDVQVSIDVEG